MNIMIFFGCVLYFLIHAIIAIIKGDPERKREKERIGKGAYVKLEWELFCEERDKYLEEHIDEKLLAPNTATGWSIIREWTNECLIRAQERLRSMGYIPAIYRCCGVWIYHQASDTYYIKRLRETYETQINYRAHSLGVALEWDRDPFKLDEYPSKVLPYIYELPEYKKYMHKCYQ